MPSMVVMWAPSAWTANRVQLFTDLPSMSTVHAPQWVVSQPMCEPVRLRSSRRWWMSSVRGSTRPSTSLPFTVILMWVFAMASFPDRRMVSANGDSPFAIGHSPFAISFRPSFQPLARANARRSARSTITPPA